MGDVRFPHSCCKLVHSLLHGCCTASVFLVSTNQGAWRGAYVYTCTVCVADTYLQRARRMF